MEGLRNIAKKLVEMMVWMGFPDYVAFFYEHEIGEGRYIVEVKSEDGGGYRVNARKLKEDEKFLEL